MRKAIGVLDLTYLYSSSWRQWCLWFFANTTYYYFGNTKLNPDIAVSIKPYAGLSEGYVGLGHSQTSHCTVEIRG
jgi:hypothetical protein